MPKGKKWPSGTQPVEMLSPREKEIMRLVPRMTNLEIRQKLGIKRQTLGNHFRLIYEKTGASERCELCQWIRSGRFRQEGVGGNNAGDTGGCD